VILLRRFIDCFIFIFSCCSRQPVATRRLLQKLITAPKRKELIGCLVALRRIDGLDDLVVASGEDWQKIKMSLTKFSVPLLPKPQLLVAVSLSLTNISFFDIFISDADIVGANT
jgi:hypothetical protein